MKTRPLLPIILALTSGVSAHATVWNASADLLANEVPNGPQELLSLNPTVPQWSYGYRLTLASTDLTLFSSSDHFGASDSFQGFNSNTAIVAVNTTSSPVYWSGNAVAVPAGEIYQHPGAANEFSIVRWTAPAAGTYYIDARWAKLDSAWTGSTSSIVINGTTVFDQLLVNFDTAVESRAVALAPGDTVDFAVGANGSYFSDSTSFNATISNVPEPSSALLVAFGGVAMLQRWRRVAKARA